MARSRNDMRAKKFKKGKRTMSIEKYDWSKKEHF